MKLYVYDRKTKELIGSVEAHLDPLESIKVNREVYVIPPYCTPFIPLEAGDNKVNVFNTEKGIWELVEDNRGLQVYDKKGTPKIIEELGPVPTGYSKTKKYNLQEEKLKLTDSINVEYAKEYSKQITVGNITDNIDARVKLEELKKFVGDGKFGTYTTSEGTSVILSTDEIGYLSKYFYVRSLLLPIVRNELLKKIKQAKNKAQLEDIIIDFNVEKDTKALAKKSEEEINDFVRDSLK